MDRREQLVLNNRYIWNIYLLIITLYKSLNRYLLKAPGLSHCIYVAKNNDTLRWFCERTSYEYGLVRLEKDYFVVHLLSFQERLDVLGWIDIVSYVVCSGDMKISTPISMLSNGMTIFIALINFVTLNISLRRQGSWALRLPITVN